MPGCRTTGEKTAASWPGTGYESVGNRWNLPNHRGKDCRKLARDCLRACRNEIPGCRTTGETTAASWPGTGYCVPRPRFWAAWTQLPVPVCCVKARKLPDPVSFRQTRRLSRSADQQAGKLRDSFHPDRLRQCGLSRSAASVGKNGRISTQVQVLDTVSRRGRISRTA
jgi:hypothetical protein